MVPVAPGVNSEENTAGFEGFRFLSNTYSSAFMEASHLIERLSPLSQRRSPIILESVLDDRFRPLESRVTCAVESEIESSEQGIVRTWLKLFI